MPTLQVRDFPDSLLQALKARAEAAGRSLTQQIIVELERAVQSPEPSQRKEVLKWMTEAPFLARRDHRMPTDWAALVREDRDR